VWGFAHSPKSTKITRFLIRKAMYLVRWVGCVTRKMCKRTQYTKYSVILIRINIIYEFFKPAWAKNNHQQANGTGNRNGADTKNHADNKKYCTFDSGPARNVIHCDYSTRLFF
jgi:hypothetical protein